MSVDKIQEDARLQKLFARAFKHPILGSKAQWVSVEWLLEIAAPAGAIGDGMEPEGEELFKETDKKGLRDPLIIACGSVEGRVRLETGAALARALLAKGVLHAPAVALLAENAWVDKGNGEHEGKKLKLWATPPEAPLGIYAERVYMSPSDLIPSCPAFDQKGFAEERAPAKKEVKKPVGKAPVKEAPKPRKPRGSSDAPGGAAPEPKPSPELPATLGLGFGMDDDFAFDPD